MLSLQRSAASAGDFHLALLNLKNNNNVILKLFAQLKQLFENSWSVKISKAFEQILNKNYNLFIHIQNK